MWNEFDEFDEVDMYYVARNYLNFIVIIHVLGVCDRKTLWLVLSFYKIICYTIWVIVVSITIEVIAIKIYPITVENYQEYTYSKNAFGVLNGDIKGQFVLKNKGV